MASADDALRSRLAAAVVRFHWATGRQRITPQEALQLLIDDNPGEQTLQVLEVGADKAERARVAAQQDNATRLAKSEARDTDYHRTADSVKARLLAMAGNQRRPSPKTSGSKRRAVKPVARVWTKKPRSGLDAEVTAVLRDWLFRNLDNPFPSRLEKEELLAECGPKLDLKQLDYWFINARRRSLPPLLEARAAAHAQLTALGRTAPAPAGASGGALSSGSGTDDVRAARPEHEEEEEEDELGIPGPPATPPPPTPPSAASSSPGFGPEGVMSEAVCAAAVESMLAREPELEAELGLVRVNADPSAAASAAAAAAAAAAASGTPSSDVGDIHAAAVSAASAAAAAAAAAASAAAAAAAVLSSSTEHGFSPVLAEPPAPDLAEQLGDLAVGGDAIAIAQADAAAAAAQAPQELDEGLRWLEAHPPSVEASASSSSSPHQVASPTYDATSSSSTMSSSSMSAAAAAAAGAAAAATAAKAAADAELALAQAVLATPEAILDAALYVDMEQVAREEESVSSLLNELSDADIERLSSTLSSSSWEHYTTSSSSSSGVGPELF